MVTCERIVIDAQTINGEDSRPAGWSWKKSDMDSEVRVARNEESQALGGVTRACAFGDYLL
jgi:hypothetical protein